MTIERGLTRLLIVLSILILVLGAWISGEQLRQSRNFHEWSTESGCGIQGSVLDWCSPAKRASSVEVAALSKQAAVQYALWTVALIAALWATFFHAAPDRPRVQEDAR